MVEQMMGMREEERKRGMEGKMEEEVNGGGG